MHYFWNTNSEGQHTQADPWTQSRVTVYQGTLVLRDTQGTEISAIQVLDEKRRSLFSCYHNLQVKGNPTNLYGRAPWLGLLTWRAGKWSAGCGPRPGEEGKAACPLRLSPGHTEVHGGIRGSQRPGHRMVDPPHSCFMSRAKGIGEARVLAAADVGKIPQILH